MHMSAHMSVHMSVHMPVVPGAQRFGGAVWSGDTNSDFGNLQQQFRVGLNMALSGVAYWTTDIGGYMGGDYSKPAFRQLVVRW